jgi:signal transduction histidine kinase
METLRVQVVDDEPGMRMGVARALRGFTVQVPNVNEEYAFSVHESETGQHFFESLAQAQPDILLLDYRLPDMTGTEILDRIGARANNDMVVIVITAYASIETALATAKRGAYDFLAKPFTPEELTNAVRNATIRLTLMRQARKLAAERQRVRFEFISVLAHELKAPLNAIEGYLRLIENRTAGADLAAYDKMVHRCLARVGGMRKLIFDLLDLTRIESGEKKRNLQTVNVRTVADEVVEALALTAREKDVTVHVDAPPDVPMVADPEEVAILLSNMVSNAINYNRAGGRVDVAMSVEGDFVTVAVRDTGIGMTPQEAGKVFKEFARIKNEKTRNIQGTGLGLSTVKKIAALYGGQVTVQSEPAVGSTFTAKLRARAPGA